MTEEVSGRFEQRPDGGPVDDMFFPDERFKDLIAFIREAAQKQYYDETGETVDTDLIEIDCLVLTDGEVDYTAELEVGDG